MKDWMYKFRGVATKHLGNYICWFKWLQYFNTEKDIVKNKQLSRQVQFIQIQSKEILKSDSQFTHNKLYNGIGRNSKNYELREEKFL